MLKINKEFKNISLGVIASAALSVAFAPAAFAQCTTNAWSSTTGSVNATGSGATKTELEYEGNCGLSVQAASSPGYVTSNSPSSETLVTSRFYIYADDLALSGGASEAVIFEAEGNGNTQLQIAIVREGSGLGLVMRARDGGSLVEAAEVAPLRPTWQAVSVSWAADASNGAASLKVDGFDMLEINNLDNDGEFVGNVDLGLINDVPGTGKVVFDAFEMRRTSPEPNLLAVNEMANISTRLDVGNGASAGVAGFVISGATQKCVVIRGRGQSVNIGLTKLDDPFITLQAAGNPAILDSNDNWGDHPGADVMIATGTQPGDPSDAAIYTCLEPGAYTARLTAASGGLGIGIVEVNDLDQGTPFLVNISTRAEYKTGGRRGVAGFIISGAESRTVLIRGRGPSVGINRPKLEDPTLELRQGSNILASNNNWQDAANSGDIDAEFQPGNSAEAAIQIELQPGAYTVFIGPNGSSQTGIGLVEVFDRTGGSIEDN